MKAASEVSFKMLLPIKVEANIVHPPPPGVVDVGQCMLVLQKDMTPVEPDFFGTSTVPFRATNGPPAQKPHRPLTLKVSAFNACPPRSRIQHRSTIMFCIALTEARDFKCSAGRQRLTLGLITARLFMYAVEEVHPLTAVGPFLGAHLLKCGRTLESAHCITRCFLQRRKVNRSP